MQSWLANLFSNKKNMKIKQSSLPEKNILHHPAISHHVLVSPLLSCHNQSAKSAGSELNQNHVKKRIILQRGRGRETAGRSTSVGMRLQKFPEYSWTWRPYKRKIFSLFVIFFPSYRIKCQDYIMILYPFSWYLEHLRTNTPQLTLVCRLWTPTHLTKWVVLTIGKPLSNFDD